MAAGLYDITNETLGKGHFAVVKKAKHCLTGEPVALKIIDKSRLNRENLQQLGIEIRLLQILSEHEHQNIMKLYQVIDTKTKLYLVTEFCGEKDKVRDLYDYLHRASTAGLPEPEARHLFRQICDAISYCHSLRIVHRDLKPENILIVDPPDGYDPSLILGKSNLVYPLVKLIDFGFSNQWDEGQKLRTSCGSLAYSAPEILVGDHYDGAKVDIWGLGCILYILLYGVNPFMQVNDSETICRILDCTFSMPPRVGVSPEAGQLIKSLLKRDPGSRLTVKEILLHPWLQRDKIAALPSVSYSSGSSVINSSIDSDTDSLGGSGSHAEKSTPSSTPPPPHGFPSPIHNGDNTGGGVTSEHPTKPKIAKIGRQSTRERLHESVVDLMLKQGMCSTRGDIEKVLENTKSPSPDAKTHTATSTNVTSAPLQKAPSSTLIPSNVRPTSTESVLTGFAGPDSTAPSTPAIKNEMYIRATYHLLKDKLIREQAAARIEKANRENMPARRSAFPTSRGPRRILQPQQRPRFTPPLPEESESDTTPRKSASPQNVSPAKTTPISVPPGRVSQMPINGPDPSMIEEGEEEETDFALPLQRKCSIVSEENSCHGCDTGSETGSVLGDGSEGGGRNLSRGSSRNFDTDGLPTIGRQLMQMPIVEIIITDCSDGERERSSDEDDESKAPTERRKSSDSGHEKDVSQSEDATVKENEPQRAVFDLTPDKSDSPTDESQPTTPEEVEVAINSMIRNQQPVESNEGSALHMVSSSPELFKQAEEESSNRTNDYYDVTQHRPSMPNDYIAILTKSVTSNQIGSSSPTGVQHPPPHPSHIHDHILTHSRKSYCSPQRAANVRQFHHAHFHHHAKPVSTPSSTARSRLTNVRNFSLDGSDSASCSVIRFASSQCRYNSPSGFKSTFNKIVPETIQRITAGINVTPSSHNKAGDLAAPTTKTNSITSNGQLLSSGGSTSGSRAQHSLEDSLNAQIRIITTSKSCNILYDESETTPGKDKVDGGQETSQRNSNAKKRSSKRKNSNHKNSNGNCSSQVAAVDQAGGAERKHSSRSSIKSISERLVGVADLRYGISEKVTTTTTTTAAGHNNNNNMYAQDEDDGPEQAALKAHHKRYECCTIS